MSEIEKMYENARAYYFRYDCDVSFKDGNFGRITNCSKGEIKDYCTDKKYFKKAKVINVRHLYPTFTAKKQIELIKTIETKCDLVDCIQIVYRPIEDLWKVTIIPVLEMSFEEMYLYFGCDKDFSTALAMAINNLWQDLTEEEKQQVKGILK